MKDVNNSTNLTFEIASVDCGPDKEYFSKYKIAIPPCCVFKAIFIEHRFSEASLYSRKYKI